MAFKDGFKRFQNFFGTVEIHKNTYPTENECFVNKKYKELRLKYYSKIMAILEMLQAKTFGKIADNSNNYLTNLFTHASNKKMNVTRLRITKTIL